MRTIISVYGPSGANAEELVSLLSTALFESGFHVMSFTAGSEGTIKFDKTPFESRSIAEDDYILAAGKVDVDRTVRNAKRGCIAIFNSSEAPKSPALKKKGVKAHYVDVSAINRPLLVKSPSAAMAGGFAKFFNKVPLKKVRDAAVLLGDKYGKSAEEGFRSVR